jgi:dihydroxyacetone kinase
MIVKNYTGDKLNFGLAAVKARALGLNVEVVMVGDDVSVTNNPTVGRRGLAGVVFVHKIAGAVAAKGYVHSGNVALTTISRLINIIVLICLPLQILPTKLQINWQPQP